MSKDQGKIITVRKGRTETYNWILRLNKDYLKILILRLNKNVERKKLTWSIHYSESTDIMSLCLCG